MAIRCELFDPEVKGEGHAIVPSGGKKSFSFRTDFYQGIVDVFCTADGSIGQVHVLTDLHEEIKSGGVANDNTATLRIAHVFEGQGYIYDINDGRKIFFTHVEE